jgi:phosphatidylethanolamine-binding protein (PEBP) family uncharacterized protein
MGYAQKGRWRTAAIRILVALLTALVLAACAALAGCGGSSTSSSSSSANGTSSAQPPATASAPASPSTTTTSSPSEAAPSTSIEVTIPGLLKEGYIPKRYTCDGANTSFPVQWSKIPSGTAAVAMFLVNLRPVHGKLFFGWAVTGLSPTSRGVPAGTVPAEAIVGRNSFGKVGYSICPPKGTVEEHFILRVVALPHPLPAKAGFDAEALYKEAESSAKVVGLAGGVYTRR